MVQAKVILCLLLVALLLMGLLVVLILAPLYLSTLQNSGSGGGDIATAAELLQQHIFGSQANEYDPTDPLMKQVMGFWAQSCVNPKTHQMCDEAKSGQLNCVEFVTAAAWLAGDPLPVHPDAVTFWSAYAGKAGWQEIPAPGAFDGATQTDSLRNTLIVWQGGQHFDKTLGKVVAYGHIGVVLHYTPPQGGKPGSIEVAESNAPGNKWPALSLKPYVASDRPGNTYTMSVQAGSYRIDTWGAYTAQDGTQYGPYSVLGFIRHLQAPAVRIRQNGPFAMTLPAGVDPNNAYVQDAIADANQAGIPYGYFVRQIYQESGFNPKAVSPMGAVGIAQFLPSTAAGMGINPWEPVAALRGAALMMATSARQYGGDYAKALAAYNAGGATLTGAVARCGSQWLTCMPAETQNYVRVIMGTS